MTTLEEAQATGEANHLIENNLSKVKIIHTSKGVTTWEISVKHEDPYKSAIVATEIHEDLRKKYGTQKERIYE